MASRKVSENHHWELLSLLNCFGRSRTAGAIRTAAVTCLQALLQSNFLLETHVGKLLSDLQPKVKISVLITIALMLWCLVNVVFG